MKLSTSFLKIACGYALLVGVLAGTFCYLYRQTQAVGSMSAEAAREMAHRRAVEHLLGWMLEAENRAQAVSLGRGEAYPLYVEAADSVSVALMGLDTLLRDSVQHARMDTLRHLLLRRRESLEALLALMGQDGESKVLGRRIADLRSGRTPLKVSTPTVSGEVVNEERTYEVERSKKGFFRRLADAFRRPHTDTMAVHQHTAVRPADTAQTDLDVSGRVADELERIRHEAGAHRQVQRSRTEQQAEQLRLAGQAVTQGMGRLLKSIEAQEQRRSREALERETQRRRQAARTVGGVAACAATLALLLLGRVWYDIRQGMRYRRRLEQAKQRAESLLQQREQLMLTITHDIKAPAGAILGYLELAQQPTADARKLPLYLQSMESAAAHLLQLVTSLLDYHRLEAGKMDVRPVSFNPARLVRETTEALRPMALRKGLELTCHITSPELTDRTCLADAFRLRQILNNLLTNALKFTQEGSVSLTAGVAPDGRLTCRVTDTGCGMTAAEKERIFQAFTRLESAGGQDGVGLGLAITQRLVSLLGGHLDVKSSPGSGSTFEVSLPLQYAGMPDALQASAAAPLRGRRILLLDDDRLQLQLTVEMLGRLGIAQTDIAALYRPEDAFARLAAERFDVLLTDVQMPAMGGFDVLHHVRRLPPPGGTVPVVAVTARADMDEATLRQAGFSGCLHKPFGLSGLEGVLHRVWQLPLVPAALPEAVGAAPQSPADPFAPLLEFAGDDREAAREILTTLRQETVAHAAALAEALENRDTAGLARLGHKLLPTFTLLQSDACADLRVLEALRGQTAWVSEAEAPARRVGARLQRLKQALDERLDMPEAGAADSVV